MSKNIEIPATEIQGITKGDYSAKLEGGKWNVYHGDHKLSTVVDQRTANEVVEMLDGVRVKYETKKAVTHSPAPWEFFERPSRDSDIPFGIHRPLSGASAVEVIADIWGVPANDEQREHMRCNARLIASAPELLELLKEAHADPHANLTIGLHGRIEDLIAKATGN